ncbi:hypothetical protein [Streptosporangium sp. NPDC002524]|uniref:hypothetical protein n=1 Tax=Streptosporangium sp. NPDC002524 TaxID=3154537 RepID=UPI003332DD95
MGQFGLSKTGNAVCRFGVEDGADDAGEAGGEWLAVVSVAACGVDEVAVEVVAVEPGEGVCGEGDADRA